MSRENEYMEIAIILDRSGSMQTAKTDHEGGLNSFITSQRDLGGDVRLTLTQFDTANPCEIVYDGEPIANVTHVTLLPRGGTPLYDAIGLAVSHLRNRLKDKHPDQTLVMVITDGEENSSHEWDKTKVKALITECQRDMKWTFLFLGANFEAYNEGSKVGFATANTVQFNNLSAASVRQAYNITSAKTATARALWQDGGAGTDVSSAYNYSAAERDAIATGTTNTTITTSESTSKGD